MNKNLIRGIIVAAVALVLYVLAAFLIPFAKTPAFWTSFIFTLLAFAIAAYALYTAFEKNETIKSKFYGFPVARVGIVYWAIQVVVGLIVMALGKWIPGWITVLVYAIGLGVAVTGLISTEMVMDELERQDTKLKQSVSAMRSLQTMVSTLASQSGSTAIKKLAEEFRYSDPVSSEATADTEAELKALLDTLQQAVFDGDAAAADQLCPSISSLLMERNRLCKLSK